MHADVPRLCREDDRRFALEPQEDVRVAVDDLEAGEVRDRAFEAGVLGAGHDDGVDTGVRHRVADADVAARSLVVRHCVCTHDRSNPFTSAQIAVLRGVGTSWSRPKRTIPPFR